MSTAPMLIGGEWRTGGNDAFETREPATGEPVGRFPVSPWSEIEEALDAGFEAYRSLREADPATVAWFLRRYAERIDERSEEIAQTAHRETALPVKPRLADVELQRTTNQLRQAADAVETRSWTRPTLSPKARIASMLVPLPGVVPAFGPNNFPLAFNGISGGDFAAAVATHHPVLAKANPGHPLTTRILGEEALGAVQEVGLHPATVQLVYHMTPENGTRLVADQRVAATGFTGSRAGGLALKAAADAAGKPIYLEMSSVNPVVVLPGALRERAEEIAKELAGSLLLGCGQFCTKPGIVFVPKGEGSSVFVERMAEHVREAPSGTLLTEAVRKGLLQARSRKQEAGARILAEGNDPGFGASFANTLMIVDGARFGANREALQAEAFGNLGLLVEVESAGELREHLEHLEGNLTGTIYAATNDSDDDVYPVIESVLRERVGRLLNDKPPTGVAVVAAMQHGGPHPATGHPGFTSVGIPASLTRFTMLQSFDNVPDRRLPLELQASNPLGIERYVDGQWTRDAVTWG